MGRFLRNNKGIALILTLLIISIIVSVTLQFNRYMRDDLYAAVNLRDGIKHGHIAKSGFNYALAVLYEDDTNVDFLHDTWADSETLSEKSADLFEDGRFKLELSDHSGMIQINSLVDEKGKYNNIQKDLLTRFLQTPEFGLKDEEVDHIVNAIKDWIDADDDPTGFGGAENSYYQGLETPYSCQDAPVEFIEELLLVKGISRELYEGTDTEGTDKIPGIKSFLSPHGDGKININTADPLVLRALISDNPSDKMKEEMAHDMDEYRLNEDNKESLSGTNWYMSVPGMDGVNIPPDLLTTLSTFFEINSEGQQKRANASEGFEWVTAKQVTAIVQRKDGELNILSWKIE